MKKLLPIFLALIIFFTSTIMQVNKANAFVQFAIPAGAGAFALGAVAVAGAATLLGNEELARSAGNMAQKTWETVDSATRSAVQAVSQWIPKDSFAPDLKIDYGSLSEDVATTLKYRGTGLAYTTASMSDAKNIEANAESVEKWNVEGTSITTKYPDASATYNSYRMTLNMNTSTTGQYFFLTSASGSVWYSEQILVQKSGGIYQNFTLTGYKLNARNPLQYYSNMTIGSNFNIAPSAIENPYGTIEYFLEKLNIALQGKYTLGIVSSSLVQDIRENAYGNTIESSYTEAWETQKDAGLVIGGQAILDANPGVTWDGTKYVDQTGTAVDTGTLVIPNPTTYTDEAGNIRVGAPTADGTIALDGTTVGTGTGTGEGTGTGTGETSGILQGLWDWLKGILQKILDAILSLAQLIGIIGVIQSILNLVESISNSVTGWKDAPTKKIEWSRLTVAAGTLTTVFPFSIPWDVYRLFSVMNVQPITPKFEISTNKTVDIVGASIPIKYDFDVDFSIFNPIAAIGRWGLILIFDISIIMALRRLTPD